MSSLITLVRQWLQEASEQMQTPVTLPLGLLLGVPAALLVIWLIWHRHHQQALAAKAWLADPRIKGSQYEEGLKAIQETTASLSAFVESYRKMTQLQKPVPTDVNLQQVASTLQAMYPALTWHVHLDEAPTVFTDAHLLLQIMVNMAKNAAEAGAAHMGLHWHDRLLISNDGQPIPSDVRREIFVPFFTTKRTGSGIGLSFSRQIIMAQGGNLTLLPIPMSGYHTTFALTFPRQQ